MVRQSGTTIRKLKAMRSPLALAAPTKATPRGHLILMALILLLLFASANRARAAAEEGFPQKPVTLIIPFSAGGSHDRNARVVTRIIPGYLGQPMIVKLVPGSGGQKGAREVAEAKPDGYTLLFGHNLIDQLQPHVADLTYDPLTAFRAVWKLNEAVAVIYVPAKSRFTTLNQLLSYGLEHPGELVFPNSGKWGFSFTVGAMLMAHTGLRANLVLYKGGGPVRAAILSGDGDFASTPYSNIRSLHQAGKVRVLASVTAERLASLPDVPSFGELGMPYAGAVMERIVMAPAATPDNRIRVLQKAFRKLYQDSSFQQLMTNMGENLEFMNGADYQAIRSERSGIYKALVDRILQQ
jgi:tripartite-type tricarboxylate transporter receptor subunit TctC